MKVTKIASVATAAAFAGIGLGACGSLTRSEPVAPAVTAPATHPAPTPKSKPVVLRFHGSGTWNSPSFKVGSTVIVKYRYSDNTSGYGGDNFIADVENSGDDQNIANDIAVSGNKTTTLYPDTSFGGSSKYHLSVTATGPWYFKVITGLNGRSKTVYANAGQGPVAPPAAQAPATHAPAAAAPVQSAAPAAQQPGQDGYVGDANVVEQYLGDISSGDYTDAWALGGGNIAGADYDTWVAGYATTTSITADSVTELGDGAVQASFTATQSDGGTTSYAGTYYVSGGVITSASITQTG
jgi:hypothetical protein